MPELNFKINREQINALFQKHKPYFILGGLVLVVAVAGLFKMTLGKSPAVDPGLAGKPPAGKSSDAAAAAGTFLPQSTRTLDDETDYTAGMRDPFNFMELKGTITGSGGKNLAILEDGNSAYVVEKGSLVAGDWTVVKIDNSGVLLEAGGQELQLEFGGRAKARDLPAQETTKSGKENKATPAPAKDKEVTNKDDSPPED